MTEKNTAVELKPCRECGMPCHAEEYHPYAACLMFRGCWDSKTVRANLDAIRSNLVPKAARRVVTMEQVTRVFNQRGFYKESPDDTEKTLRPMKIINDLWIDLESLFAEPETEGQK